MKKLQESFFQGERPKVRHLDYGDRFDDLWGVESIELSRDDITALQEGKVLRASVNDEYAVLIRIKNDKLCKEEEPVKEAEKFINGKSVFKISE